MSTHDPALSFIFFNDFSIKSSTHMSLNMHLRTGLQFEPFIIFESTAPSTCLSYINISLCVLFFPYCLPSAT